VSVENARLSDCIDSDKPYSFELIAKTSSDIDEVMILAAPSDEEMRKWVAAICHIAHCTANWIAEIPSLEPVILSESNPTDSTFVETMKTETERSISPGYEYELNQIDEDDNEVDLPIRNPLQRDTVEVPPVVVLIPNHSQDIPKVAVRTEEHPEMVRTQEPPPPEPSKEPEAKDLRGGAPFLRGSSGYDFGSKVEKLFIAPEPIAEEDGRDDVVISAHAHLSTDENENKGRETLLSSPLNSPTSSSSPWLLSCQCSEIFPQIGTRLLRRCQLFSQLFPSSITSSSYDSSTLFNFQLVKELLSITDSSSPSSQISLSYPYLPSSGCSWINILKYLRYVERNHSPVLLPHDEISDLMMTLECSLFNQSTSQETHFQITLTLTITQSKSSIDVLTEKVRR
jgi:hypothetical protein